MLAMACLGACTRPVAVESTWLEGVPRDQSFHNVLVIGVSPAFNTRCRYERALAAILRSASVKATASCTVMDMKDPLTKESVTPVVASLGADAVLATRLVAHKADLVEGGTNETRGRAFYKPVGYGVDSYYGSYGLPVTYVDFVAEESALTLERTATISTNLYETRNASLIYTMDTTAFDKDSQGAIIDAMTTAIADRLRRDGLVGK